MMFVLASIFRNCVGVCLCLSVSADIFYMSEYVHLCESVSVSLCVCLCLSVCFCLGVSVCVSVCICLCVCD